MLRTAPPQIQKVKQLAHVALIRLGARTAPLRLKHGGVDSYADSLDLSAACTGVNGTDPDPALPLPPRHPPDRESGDWDNLLRAVETRLRRIVDRELAALPAPDSPDALNRFRGGSLGSVAALNRLQTTLEREIAQRHHLEQQLAETRTALAHARDELAGTRAGERLAHHLALHDSLTSLPNRVFFRERLDAALIHANEPGHAFTVLYIDLDGFKLINDAHGHDAGDELLRIVAARMSRGVRADDVVSRIGGDEFACLLADISSRQQLTHLALKLFNAVAAPVKLGRVKLVVRPSIGIAMCPIDGATAETLLKKADVAMYRAKGQKTGHEFFAQGADHSVSDAGHPSILPFWRSAIGAARRTQSQR